MEARKQKSAIPLQYKAKSKRVSWKSIALTACFIFVAAASAIFFYVFSGIAAPKPWVQAGYLPPESSQPSEIQALPELKDRTNILIYGVDQRDEDAGRSDTIILASVPSDGGRITMMSIPRDTMVWLPEYERYDKISHTYNDGPEYTLRTVSRLLDLPISGYVIVNLEGFVGLVDELGGVTVDAGEDYLHYYDPYQDLLIDIAPGVQRMDGATAMHYVRFREPLEADIGRIRRQQSFLQAAIDEFLSKKYELYRLPGLLRTAVNMVQTDLSWDAMLALAGSGYKSIASGVHFISLSGDGLFYQDVAYYMLNLEESLTLVAEEFFPEKDRALYIAEHLQEPWVRDYEWIHAACYAEALQQWQAEYGDEAQYYEPYEDEEDLWMDEEEPEFWDEETGDDAAEEEEDEYSDGGS